MTAAPSPLVLCGGVVAYNERERVSAAIRSLFDQVLPDGVVWGELQVVVSGSTDGTDDVVRDLARVDPRVHAIVQPRRDGKSAALAELFRQARGDYLVVLNGDAVAAPGALAALLAAAGGPDDRFAVMARPVPRQGPPRSFASAVELLWSIHHAFHQEVLRTGEGNHLSDELLLLPVRQLPPMGAGIVNDGSFVGGWLHRNDGSLRYAPEAIVRITSPRTLREHVRQRRRILYGHRQVRERLAVEPVTIERYARSHPLKAIRIVANETRRPGGVRALSTLLVAEALALVLAEFDARAGRRDHVLWRPILGHDPEPMGEPARTALSAEGA